MLKSLVVYDDKGGVGGLSLPGREPLAQAFKDLPFDQDSLGSPAELLADPEGRAGHGRRQPRDLRPHRVGRGGQRRAAATTRA